MAAAIGFANGKTEGANKVTPDEKQKFREYVESTNEFDSLSRRFRSRAHRHIDSTTITHTTP